MYFTVNSVSRTLRTISIYELIEIAQDMEVTGEGEHLTGVIQQVLLAL